ncbi:hypothetical protein PanWU01x14_018320 [Parasponia andersonii]|uniref:Uncharacterized protein n=1 Tax=Parasponia andersonii TaxID=3476 RepID=A0A2P5DZ52_PARAD|nr:hypothetical protein PanWU01x14_018320 [Parasponia andersonii]
MDFSHRVLEVGDNMENGHWLVVRPSGSTMSENVSQRCDARRLRSMPSQLLKQWLSLIGSFSILSFGDRSSNMCIEGLGEGERVEEERERDESV